MCNLSSHFFPLRQDEPFKDRQRRVDLRARTGCGQRQRGVDTAKKEGEITGGGNANRYPEKRHLQRIPPTRVEEVQVPVKGAAAKRATACDQVCGRRVGSGV